MITAGLALGLVVGLAVGLAVGAGGTLSWVGRSRRRALSRRAAVSRIAFPFTARGLSEPALVAALRIARAEGATLVPVYLALVPLDLPLEVALPDVGEQALPMLEVIEQRAARAEVPVDSRIERGRSMRHALAQLMAHERFERMVVAAGTRARGGEGFSAEDVAWLLTQAPGEVIALRPARAVADGLTGVSPTLAPHG